LIFDISKFCICVWNMNENFKIRVHHKANGNGEILQPNIKNICLHDYTIIVDGRHINTMFVGLYLGSMEGQRNRCTEWPKKFQNI
jgi:hypothetical protein